MAQELQIFTGSTLALHLGLPNSTAWQHPRRLVQILTRLGRSSAAAESAAARQDRTAPGLCGLSGLLQERRLNGLAGIQMHGSGWVQGAQDQGPHA